MISEQWTIRCTQGGKRWFSVKVYDTQEAMHAAAHKLKPLEGFGTFDGRLLGLVQPVPAFYHDSDTEFQDPRWPRNGMAGTIRLSANHLWTEVIYHELVHAACQVYRMNFAREINLGPGWEDLSDEENFAYIYGQLAADMATALHLRADAR